MLREARHWSGEGFRSVLLLPLRVTKAFQQHILGGAHRLLFCDKRITFWENGAPRLNPRTGKPDPALFDSIIVVYEAEERGALRKPVVGLWRVPPHTPDQIAIAARRAA